MKSKWWLVAFLFCLLVACLSPLASKFPDGLDFVAEEKGFVDREVEAPFSIIAGYAFPGVENEALATILAGLAGTAIVFGAAYGITWLIVSQKRKQHN